MPRTPVWEAQIMGPAQVLSCTYARAPVRPTAGGARRAGWVPRRGGGVRGPKLLSGFAQRAESACTCGGAYFAHTPSHRLFNLSTVQK